MKKSIPSAYALNPGELILCMDAPKDTYLEVELDKIEQSYRKPKPPTRRIYVDKDPEWKMPLAHIVWEVYRKAKFDKLYHFDIDHTVNKVVLIGKDLLKDDIILVSFTKRLYVNSIPTLLRFINYRMRTRQSESVFSGNYWINRKLFFDIMDKKGYQQITNGIDTYLLERVKILGLKMINRKEMGVNALSLQNEHYDWRQFQDGIWWYVHREEMKAGKIKTGMIRRSFLKRRPELQMLLKCWAYQTWSTWKGWNWAKKNPDHEICKLAKNYDRDQWTYFGSKNLPKDIKFKDLGTGHVEY